LSGEPVDLWVCDDPFKNRESADSPVVQEKVWEWHMDDVTPRIQQGGAYILIHTRWTPGDLIGRIQTSEDARNWRYVRLPAVAESQAERDRVNGRQGLPVGEPDPLERQEGQPLCAAAFDAASLQDKRTTLGVGFESLYQQNPVPRGGSFFQREWFAVVDAAPAGRYVRYWDLASSRDDEACYTAGVLLGKAGEGEASRYYVADVIRGRWQPAERNDVILQTAQADSRRPGFERTYFEKPVFDKGGAASRAIVAKLSGYPVLADNVGGAGSKELRAEPVAGAAKAGLVSVVAGAWVATFLTEIEAFPKGQWKDQTDSLSGGYNRLVRGPATVSSFEF
jgi:predicted phage terminase large subunit-like protein